MVKRYHGSFPSFSYGFNSRYPLHCHENLILVESLYGADTFK